jgi:AT-rich interactive domain-containing protein 2
VSYLSLHDIHLLISTLECIYAISCHGEATCNAIARTHGALETLVSLVTVEAQSYGPKACILMRVVETVPGSNANAVHAQTTQLQPLAVPATVTAPAAPVMPLAPTNGLKPDQLAQLGQLTPIQPHLQQQPQQQMVTMAVSQPQPMPVMGQQGAVIRGQLMQVPGGQQQIVAPQQQQPPVMQLPRHPLPVLRPGTPNATAVVMNPQQQQTLQLQQKGQMSGGSIIITTTPNAMPGSQPMQLQQVVQPQQLPQTPLRPTIVGGVLRPAMAPQPQPQLPVVASPQQPPSAAAAGSQQVQLRVSNDDLNRQFCLSWLKATYELAQGSSIEQQVMYKQYLASLHKLGKREVISAQHYAVCVR